MLCLVQKKESLNINKTPRLAQRNKVTFDDNLNNRDFAASQETVYQPMANMPAAPPSNFQGFNTMPFNPMMSGMPNLQNMANVPNMQNMGGMGYNYGYQGIQNPFFPMQPNMAPQMYGTPGQGPGMGMIPQVPMNGPQVQFPDEPTAPRNMNNSMESSLERAHSPIMVDDGKCTQFIKFRNSAS